MLQGSYLQMSFSLTNGSPGVCFVGSQSQVLVHSSQAILLRGDRYPRTDDPHSFRVADCMSENRASLLIGDFQECRDTSITNDRQKSSVIFTPLLSQKSES